MNEEWLYLLKKYKEAGARSKFEEVCETLFKKMHPEKNVRSVRVVVGDGGIDIFIGDIELGPVEVIQCKFFVRGVDDVQKKQIRDSFRTAIESDKYKCSKWTLCVPIKLGVKEHKWWAGWKSRQIKVNNRNNDFIQLIDGGDLIDKLREYSLYDMVFDEEISKAIKELYTHLIKSNIDIRHEFLIASSYLQRVKNHFSDLKETHIHRIESTKVIDWVSKDLKGENILEKVFIIKGKKGVGKSTILRDIYCELIEKEDCIVLGIKCDQYYDRNLPDLFKKLFDNISSARELISTVQQTDKSFIVILDQLDALSQTLSSDRSFINTYIRLIDELIDLPNIRIVISARTYDLEYDADLRRFNESRHVQKIEVNHLSKESVKEVLKKLNIDSKSETLIDLLTVPYNLELFTKIPNVSTFLKRGSIISLSKLYSELWKQVLTKKNLEIMPCLNAIIGRMYEVNPNLASQFGLEQYKSEIDYLLSHHILLENGSQLSFFHQSFYEYYLARWFVVSNKDLLAYIFEENQSLYIRSLIKTVIEYLREADHTKYINLYYDVLNHKGIRFHIKYLFIVELGLIEMPSEKEKRIALELTSNKYSDVFFDVVDSKGWIEFFIERDFKKIPAKKMQMILHRNLNHLAHSILNYVDNKEIINKEDIIHSLIPFILNWDSDMIHYFDRYYPYNESTQLWYFETLKKIAPLNFDFVLNKLRPAIRAEKNNAERMRFDHRFDKIVDFLFQLNSRDLCEFLISIQIEFLEETKHFYFNSHLNIESPLLGSHNYHQGLTYRDSDDERSIDYYILKYYKTADREELRSLYLKFKDTNYVNFLIILIKLLRDRAEEFRSEIVEIISTIDSKNGLKGIDDFFQLTIRKLIGKSILYFDEDQYSKVKFVIFGIIHPYEIFKDFPNDSKKYSLNIGRKKYLFIKALPQLIIERDIEIKREYQMLKRRFGDLDHNKPFDRSRSRSGFVGAPLSDANYKKFNHTAWLSSMIKIDEKYRSDDFLKGGLLEHARVFEDAVKNRPDYFYDFIGSLFLESKVPFPYISHGITGLISGQYNPDKVRALILKEISLELDREYTLYAIWHTRYLINDNMLLDEILHYWVKIALSGGFSNDVLNPDDPVHDFVNTVKGAAIYNLMHLTDYPQYQEQIFSTVELLVKPASSSSITILCGIMAHIAKLNHFDTRRAFYIFKELVNRNEYLILKHSTHDAQYFNNEFHDDMGFYFVEILKYEDLYERSYFFVTSWLFKEIDDYKLFDDFIRRGNGAVKCSLEVAENFLIKNDIIYDRALQILERCVEIDDRDGGIADDLSSIVLRKFEVKHFEQLASFIKKYIASSHFKRRPRYLLEYLTLCSSSFPLECLDLLNRMEMPTEIDPINRPFMGDEPLTLVLSIYSKLRNNPYEFNKEQQLALDIFDRMLEIPAIRNAALGALEEVIY